MNSTRKMRFDCVVEGILLLDKPPGLSSNAALQAARSIFRASKAGHTGSLDPLATGMLPICFGQATKICGWLLDAYKTYQVTAQLGIQTDTADAAGEVIKQMPVPAITADLLHATLQKFLGAQTQVPPMYSALKHQGQRLYALARRGETIARIPRPITIEYIHLQAHTDTTLTFEVRCSKGTYIRALVEDLAAALNTLAHVTALRRTQVDPFGTAPLYTLETLRTTNPEQLPTLLLPADTALVKLPSVALDASTSIALQQGRAICYDSDAVVGTTLRAYGAANEFLGLVEVAAAGVLKPRRLWKC